MNGENDHISYVSALDGRRLGPRRARFTWALFAAQLWMLAAFIGMSLFAIAAKLLLTAPNEAQPTTVLVLGVLGAALAPVAWWNLARQLGGTERETMAADAERAQRTASSRGGPAKPLLLAPHR